MSQSLLKLQIGPVQEFIAQARSTRDLWSGSYLLSWLVATGIEALGRQIAGDEATNDFAFQAVNAALIYPATENQPLMLFKFKQGAFELDPREFDLVKTTKLLTPNLPNIFVAKLEVEEVQAAKIARKVESAIREEWRSIAIACWTACSEDKVLTDPTCGIFCRQIGRFLSVAWQVIPYKEGEANYAASYEDLSTRLDGVRQCRNFVGWREGRWHREGDIVTEKDTLTGKEEAIIGGRKWFEEVSKETAHWKRGEHQNLWPILIREKHRNDYFGAITLVKRLWHWHWLHKKHGIRSLHTKESSRNETQFPFPSTRHIALHMPWSNSEDLNEDQKGNAERLDGYFAILAFDGDRIGTWVSGEFFEEGTLSEAMHLELSRKLGVFALECVRPIVDACDGRLIYAGGDDVLALLPPDTALDCARFLRLAYRGDFSFADELKILAGKLIERKRPDDEEKRREDYSPWRTRAASSAGLFPDAADLTKRMPGSICGYDRDTCRDICPEASVGIAIAHYKNPLQDTIRAAQQAETRAKKRLSMGGLGRSAVAVTLLKRSGEQVEWGCRWESGGLLLYDLISRAMMTEKLSSRFPYRMVEILSAYQGSSDQNVPEFDAKEIILQECAYILSQQSTRKMSTEDADNITKGLDDFLTCVSQLGSERIDRIESGEIPQYMLKSVIGLCQTLAFTIRPRDFAEGDASAGNTKNGLSATEPVA